MGNRLIPLAFPQVAIMAARRAYWKGYLKLSLVTCPVACARRVRR
jgi:hypothetical protein